MIFEIKKFLTRLCPPPNTIFRNLQVLCELPCCYLQARLWSFLENIAIKRVSSASAYFWRFGCWTQTSWTSSGRWICLRASQWWNAQPWLCESLSGVIRIPMTSKCSGAAAAAWGSGGAVLHFEGYSTSLFIYSFQRAYYRRISKYKSTM